MRRARALALAASLAVALGACAPPPSGVSELSTGTRQTRYQSALAARTARGVAVDADVTVWARTRTSGALPGMQAWLALEQPDAFRLRVESFFGTAFDVSARGDSVVAHVPSQRAGLRADARRDAMGVRDPGTLGYRVWSAGWTPPDRAWRTAAWRDTLLIVRWLEGEDSLEVAVGSDGLPVHARLDRADGTRAEARYEAWSHSQGPAWPSRIVFEDGSGALHAVAKVNRLRLSATPAPERLAVRFPAGTEQFDWPEFRRALESLKEF